MRCAEMVSAKRESLVTFARLWKVDAPWSGCHQTVAIHADHRAMQAPTTPSSGVRDPQPAHRSLRVAMVTETYAPEVNGVALTLARLVDGLRQRQHVVQLVRPLQHGADQPALGGSLREVLTNGMRIPMYGSLRMGLPAGRELVRLWRAERPDIVHIATEGPLGWSALQAARKLTLPVCSDFRTNFHAYSQFYGLAWLQKPIVAYLRSFHNRCDASMVPTEVLREQLDATGFERLSVVARGVDTDLFSPARRSCALRRQWGASDDDLVVLHVGRLAPEKNLDALLQAFERLRSAHPRVKLVIVGDGPSRQQLQSRCPGALFAGFRSGVDLATHYASSDVFLFPSLTETYGNVTPEAMASGLGVVAFNDAAAGQLIKHGFDGMLAPKGDAAAFSQLACAMAGDAERCRAMGRRARERTAALGWERIVRRIEETYAIVMAKSRSPELALAWLSHQRG